MNPVSNSQASLNLIKNLKRINKGQWSKDLRHHGCCRSLIQTPGSLQRKPKPNTTKRRDKTNMSSHEISTKCQCVNRKISEWLHMELMSLILILQIYIVHNSDSEEEMTNLTQFQNANANTENAAQQDNHISPSEETPNPHDINSHSHDSDMTDISSSQRRWHHQASLQLLPKHPIKQSISPVQPKQWRY